MEERKSVNYRDAAKRTIVDLPVKDLGRLDEVAAQESVSRATVLREAVAEYVVRKSKAPAVPKPLSGFGALKGYYGEAQAYQDQLRGEWE
jgi:hypothetical protein